ncbi:MAG TPA: bifunctional enoyl-CoA hydratase/phosphate acetyltransferase [Clostridiales bacterium]|nr:bifunctional enoyl-CoA hydratase/phosphate acetyltransferase [Clostridiales bacterium]HQP69501.1 bifunctional enoyl-CoA hydratase/phosphate acetyltransferase [Clostridiales bacterium]
MPVTKLEQMFEILKSKPKKRLVAAYAIDSHTIEAVNAAVDLGIVEGTLVGSKAEIEKVCKAEKIDISKFQIVDEADEMKATQKAVAIINEGKADFIMKGLVSTDKYMRAILDKEKGLMPPKAILSHVTVVEVPTYPKLLIVSDVAIIPAPDLPQKIAITNYVINTAGVLGIEKPKVAMIAATEQMSAGMPACVDAAIISKMCDRGQIKNAFVDGPLAMDVAIDAESVKIKKLVSPVAGDADCLVFPNIESGNVFFKTCTKFAGGELAAVVVGAKCPAVLTSRGDSSKTKTYSIALACMMSK